MNPRTISDLVADVAARDPDAAALLAPDGTAMTYRSLHERMGAVAATLADAGVGPGDRVALVLPNGPAMASAVLGVAAAATCAPLNPTYKTAELEFYLDDLGAALLILDETLDSPARKVAANLGVPVVGVTEAFGPAGTAPVWGSAEDVALVLHTSGTTSRPKQVPLTQANLLASAGNIVATLDLTAADRCLNVMPLFHIHGIVAALLASLRVGASVVCTAGFTPDGFRAAVQELGPTWYTAVPTIHQAVVDTLTAAPVEGHHLRFARSSSSALPPGLFTQLEATLGVPVVEAYGMTEGAHQITSNRLPPGTRKAGTVGVPVGTEVVVADADGRLLPQGETGEILIRGNSVTAGYLGAPGVNDTAFVDGWLRTGDQGALDEDGYLRISGRLKEIINKGGEKISPREIDEVLLEHPDVKQALTFAVPHPTLGEDVAVAIVPLGDGAGLEDGLRAFAASRLADFKVPRRIVVLDELPKGATGKPQRIGLAERLGLGSDAPAPTSAAAAPQSALEAALLGVWRFCLGAPDLGLDDDFFVAGGDSLQAFRLLAHVVDVFGAHITPDEMFDDASTARRMAAVIGDRAGERRGTVQPIAGAAHGDASPLSFSQQRIWFLDQLAPGDTSWNSQIAYRLSGPLDEPALRGALEAIVRRHDSLRTTFPAVEGQPRQVVVPFSSLALEIRDLTAAGGDSALAAAIAAEGARPFDIASGPVLRCHLFRLAGDEHVLLVTVHHIVFDGGSRLILLRELTTLYHALSEGGGDPLPALPVQYPDFAVWQRAQLEADGLEPDLAYWRERLAGAPAALELPTDRARPTVANGVGAAVDVPVPEEVTNSLRSFARSEGVTLFMVLVAGFQALLARYVGTADVVIGTPSAGRSRPELEDLIGCFITTLVHRTDCAGDPSFADHVRRVREAAVGAYRHQDVPFERLVEELAPVRDPSRNPLVQMSLQIDPVPDAVSVGALTVTQLPVEVATARFDVEVHVRESADGALSIQLVYATALFDAGTAEGMATHLANLLASAMADPSRPLSALSLMDDEERRMILEAFSGGAG
jgi:acyl-CoA synthetase (AMP-forming)/AMP-acid ligase II